MSSCLLALPQLDTIKDLQSLSQSLKTAYVSTIISKTISVDLDFNLDQVKGSVVISEEVIIPALQIPVVKD